MPEKPKKEKEFTETADETGDESSWSKDQQEKSYYYDDDCGYEIYNPEDEEKENESGHE
ncbi:MAG TPA: hypothetical protein VGC76_15575 [Pyrinomonadaceae bacterium]|jgi:hypothetical protein